MRGPVDGGAGANTLTVAGGSARIDGTATVGTLDTTVEEGAHLSTNLLRQNGLSIAADGRVTLLPFGQASVITDLTIGSGATLDIGNGALVLDYTGASPVAAVRERILSGRGGAGYAVFGCVTDGMAVIDAIAASKTGRKSGHDDVPLEPIEVIRASSIAPGT